MPNKFGKASLDDVCHWTMGPQTNVLGNERCQVQGNPFSAVGDDKFHQHGLHEELVGDNAVLVVQRGKAIV